ncbi:MAG: phosphotransferase [Chloroflexi bacterium]|nr:phosphotransferase [Chloroflexota bacterium]
MPRPPTQIQTRPALSRPEAAAALARWWSIEADLEDLPSERDQNFLVRGGAGEPAFVLKVANLEEHFDFLECQNAAMARLGRAGVPVQPLVPAEDGREIVALGDPGPPWCRLLEWLPGRMLASVARPTGDLWTDLGTTMGRSASALLDFDHPAARRAFQWDVLHAATVIGDGLASIPDPDRARLLGDALARLGADLVPRLPGLRRSAIHNDANDHNVVVDDAGTRVTGLLDFGDMVHSVTAQEAAVACAYAMFERPDPAGVMGRIVAGFDATCRLTADELDALPSLVLARLGASVAISAVQARQAPHPYLRISEAPAWSMIEWFLARSPSALRLTIHEAVSR